ncbi:hypothetical protein BH09PAT4_BH09PAT4_05530 [soil metagenome]
MKQKKQRSKQIRKVVLLVCLLVAAVVFLVSRYATNNTPESGSETKSPQHQTTVAQPGKLRLIATGDMLPHDTVNQAARTSSGYDYRPLFSKVAPYLKDSDLSYCNQESPSDGQLEVSGYPTFNAPPAFANNLSQLGCNIINLANNHANDRGQAGINATLDVWNKLPTLAVAGVAKNQTNHDSVAYFTAEGVRFAFLSYTQCSNSKSVSSYGLNVFSKSFAGRQLTEARQHADMIIAAMHSCDENRSNQDTWQDETAQFFADQGVDIVIGTGPHWLQPVKQLAKAGGGKTVVWFSLGNFLSSQLEVNGLIGGIAVMEIDIKSHSVTDIGFMPTYMHYEWTAAQAAREDLLARHNLQLYPLDQASSAMALSQNHTTVAAQTDRVTKLLNKFTKVTMLTSKTYTHFGE